MTIASEIAKLTSNLADCYTACTNKGATIPQYENFDSLANCIDSISTASPAVITSLSITPSTSQQTITAPTGTDGYSPITVAAVDNTIDANITAGNIKNGVTILGVTGTYGGQLGIPREVNGSGIYTMPSSSFSFSLPSNTVDVDTAALAYAFYGCSSLTSVDLSSLTSASGLQSFSYGFYGSGVTGNIDLSNITTMSGNSSFSYAFYSTGITSVDLSSVTTVSGGNVTSHMCDSCTSLTSIDLSSLTTASGTYSFDNIAKGCSSLATVDLSSLTYATGNYSFYQAFYGCSSLSSISLATLKEVTGNYAFQYAFRGCSSLTSMTFTNLDTVTGNSAFANAFYGCSNLASISFPALTTSSFGSKTNQFNNMLRSTTGCTVHFPAAIESTIQNWTDVLAGFGGTNTVIVYDL